MTILWPIVRMIFQPPAAVPSAIVIAQSTMTQYGAWSTTPLALSSGFMNEAHSGWPLKAPEVVPTMSAKVMMPTVFWASLEPWEKPIMPAEISCSLPKRRCTTLGRAISRTITAVSRAMKTTPSAKPMNGETNIGLISLGQRPAVLPPSEADQISLPQSRCVCPRTPPQSPPMSACEELEGMPNHQVIRFQTIPPSSPQAMASCWTWKPPETSM